ncbi:hypothetical protein Scep_027892 [Stephania cephalantha]|uniref:Uncharacterized protein n=1 Tax=Stephania cephalantha TaxID=152367 RepID=A0AAP0E8T2_9MAGN
MSISLLRDFRVTSSKCTSGDGDITLNTLFICCRHNLKVLVKDYQAKTRSSSRPHLSGTGVCKVLLSF